MTEEQVIPTMTSELVLNYLRGLGKSWQGKGTALELGCWLGASSAALCEGLNEAGYNKDFWAFDKWEANDSEVIKAKEQGVNIEVDQDLSDIYFDNVEPIYNRILMWKGRAPGILQEYIGGPIEICIFDAPKQDPTFIESVRALYRNWIPGITIIGFMDYSYWKSLEHPRAIYRYQAPQRFMNRYGSHFEVIKEFDSGELFLQYKEKLII